MSSKNEHSRGRRVLLTLNTLEETVQRVTSQRIEVHPEWIESLEAVVIIVVEIGDDRPWNHEWISSSVRQYE